MLPKQTQGQIKDNIQKIPGGASWVAEKTSNAVSSVLERFKPSSYTQVATQETTQGIELV